MVYEELIQALDGLYDAAVVPDTWPVALHRFARATGSVGCRFRPVHGSRDDLSFLPASPDIGGFLQDFVAEGWERTDPRKVRGVGLLKSGVRVAVDHQICSDEERRLSPFYQTLLRRHDLPWWAGILFKVDDRWWALSILRNGKQGPFEAGDLPVLADVAPHLERVVSLAARLALAHGRTAVDALERIGRAAYVVDRAARIVAANALAEAIASDGLTIVRGFLHATDRASDDRLQRTLARATVRQPGAPPPDPVFVARREGRPLMVEALPATGAMADVFQRIAALVVVTDLDVRAKPADKVIRDAFGLTRAEASLASSLASGDELRAAGNSFGMSYETARAHLRAIFAKTHVSRQAELVALLVRLGRGARAGE